MRERTRAGKARNPVPKGDRLPSLMAHILDRSALIVVIALSLLLPAGCSGLLGGPQNEANDAIEQANEAIAEHNRLFQETRDVYNAAREALESGEDPSGQVENIVQARETLQEARSNLEEAREPLAEIQDLEVERKVKTYAGLLSEAIDDQLTAEAKEIEFYQVLEEDPILQRDRDRALDVLAQASDGYQRAEDAYERARGLADSNPELLREG